MTTEPNDSWHRERGPTLLRRIALVAWLIAALAALAFDPADPWTHPTYIMTMGGLIGLAAMVLSIAFHFAPRPRPPTTGSDV